MQTLLKVLKYLRVIALSLTLATTPGQFAVAATWGKINIEIGAANTWHKVNTASGSANAWHKLGGSRPAVNLVIAANTNNYNIFNNKGGEYVSGSTDITLTINAGVVVGSTTTAASALDTGAGWASGDTITIVNAGYILGAGGAGGQGDFAVADGGAGGPALLIQFTSVINNVGFIGGGGGGGGGGGASWVAQPGPCGMSPPAEYFSTGGGGGGGAGSQGGAGGAGGAGGDVLCGGDSVPGTAGGSGAVAGGAGGSAGLYGGAGGAGGGYGSPGTAGGAGTIMAGTAPDVSAGAAGGAGGYSIVKNGNPVTWVSVGTIAGPQI